MEAQLKTAQTNNLSTLVKELDTEIKQVITLLKKQNFNAQWLKTVT